MKKNVGVFVGLVLAGLLLIAIVYLRLPPPAPTDQAPVPGAPPGDLAPPPASGTERPARWMAASECSRELKGRSGNTVTIRVGIATFTEDRASCESAGSGKAANMAASGWVCAVEQASHACAPMTQAEEELGFGNVRQRKPVRNTYLVFTDLDGHLTQMSFWDSPKPVVLQLCEIFRKEIENTGVKDAECIPGNS